MKTVCRGAIAMLMLMHAPLRAQEQSRIAIESVVSSDHVMANTTPRAAGLAVDTFIAIRLTDKMQFVTQPLVRRLPNGDWLHKLYQLAVRYEGTGTVPLRIEVGQMMSPIGLASLRYRADMNPTVSFPASYFLRLPQLEPGGPRVEMIAPGYPVGAQVSTSKRWLDARMAVVDGSPVRMRRGPFDSTPSRAPQIVAGGGVTPIMGLRFGVSFAHGRHANGAETSEADYLYSEAHEEYYEHSEGVEEEEVYGPGRGRSATVLGFEWEYGFKYTQLRAEWLQNSLETAGQTSRARSWQAEWTQTLSPRWFAAARVERVSAVEDRGFGRAPVTFGATDATLGYRLSPELTLRAGHLARRPFGASNWDHQAGLSIVWARRWW